MGKPWGVLNYHASNDMTMGSNMIRGLINSFILAALLFLLLLCHLVQDTGRICTMWMRSSLGWPWDCSAGRCWVRNKFGLILSLKRRGAIWLRSNPWNLTGQFR
jgi:hypothetical protein